MVGANDWMPTLLAAAGVPDIKEKLLAGHTAGNKTFKVHLDGYNQLATLTGTTESPRGELFYFDDDGEFVAARLGRWKASFAVQRARGFQVWMEPFVHMRIPYIIDLKMDPFERAPENSNQYYHWFIENAYLAGLFQEPTGKFLATFRDFPPRQKPASFNVDQYMDMLTRAASSPSR